jgi:hypothetical protein
VDIRASLRRLDERFLGRAGPSDLRDPRRRRTLLVAAVVMWAAGGVVVAAELLGADAHHFLLASCVALPVAAGLFTRQLWVTRRPE